MRLSHALTTTAATAALMTIPGVALATPGGSSPAVECDGLPYLDKFTPGEGFDVDNGSLASVVVGQGGHDVAWSAAEGVTVQRVIVKAANEHFTPTATNAGRFDVPIRNAISHVTFCGTTAPVTVAAPTDTQDTPVEEPAVEEPAVEEPAVEEPAVEVLGTTVENEVCAEDSMSPGQIDNQVAIVNFSANGTATVSLKPDTDVCAVEVHLTAYSVNGNTITDDTSDYLWDDQVLHASDSVVLTPENPTATLSVGLPTCNWQLDLYTWDSGAAGDGDPRWEMGLVRNPTTEGQWAAWDQIDLSPHHGRTIRVGDTVHTGQNILMGWKLDLDNGACVDVQGEVIERDDTVEESAVEETVVEETVVEETVAEESAVEESAVEESAAEESAAEESAAEESAAEESAAEETVAEESAAEESAAEEPEALVLELDEESAVEESATEESAAEESAVEEPEALVLELDEESATEDVAPSKRSNPTRETAPAATAAEQTDEDSVEEPETILLVLDDSTDETGTTETGTTETGTDQDVAVLGEVIEREIAPAPAPVAVRDAVVAADTIEAAPVLPVTGGDSGMLALFGLVTIAGGAGLLRRGTVTVA